MAWEIFEGTIKGTKPNTNFSPNAIITDSGNTQGSIYINPEYWGVFVSNGDSNWSHVGEQKTVIVAGATIKLKSNSETTGMSFYVTLPNGRGMGSSSGLDILSGGQVGLGIAINHETQRACFNLCGTYNYRGQKYLTNYAPIYQQVDWQHEVYNWVMDNVDTESKSNIYYGVNGKAKNIKKIFIGVDGEARKVIKAFVGVNGVAKQIYSAD